MKNIEIKLLMVVFVLAGLLRFVGTNPGFNKFHSDEGVSYSAAVSMIKNKNLDPLRYDYPAGVPLLNYVGFQGFFVPIYWTKFYLENAVKIWDGMLKVPLSEADYARYLQFEVLGEREINALFWGRYVTAMVSFLNVVMVYLLGKKLFGFRTGAIAALFLAVNYKAVANAHIGLPDTYNAFLLLVSLYLSTRIFERSRKFDYLLAGIAAGVSFSIKYQFFAMFPLLFAHLCRSFWFWKRKKYWVREVWTFPLISVLAFLFGYLALNPYFYVQIEDGLYGLTYVTEKYAMKSLWFNLFPVSYFYHIDYGAVIFALVILGLAYLLVRKPIKTIFLLAFLSPYIFATFFYSMAGFYVRNFITITPLLMIFAAHGAGLVEELVLRITKNKNVARAILTAVLVAGGYTPLKNSVLNVYYYSRPWSYDLIVEKARQVLPEGAVVAGHPFDPLPEEKNIQRLPFSYESFYSLAEYREEGVEYNLVNMDWAANNFYGWMTKRFPESIQYWDKPVEKMRNSFWGLSIEEMLQYNLTAAYKPWQAPDAALFLGEVPYFHGLTYRETWRASVDGKKWNWEEAGKEDVAADILSYNAEGGVRIEPGGMDFGIVRFVSSKVEVRQGRVYEVKGEVKCGPTVKEKRNVFLRLDFYDQENGLEQRGKMVAVSPRYYGEGWKTLEAIGVAPEGAIYMRVSFQPAGLGEVICQLGEVVISESNEVYQFGNGVWPVPEKEYLDLLYPYSHGNL